MATTLAQLETLVRLRISEPTARFWTSAELIEILSAGVRDLWRDIADLKEEHFMTISESVTQAVDAYTLTGVPTDVHKIILIEPLDISEDSANINLIYKPSQYQSDEFMGARSRDSIDPTNDIIYYAITAAGTPVGAPTIRVAPAVNTEVELSFAYVPSVGTLTSASNNPIPGESDNALVAWAVAFARAKEREDLAPDPSWMAVYSTEKLHLLQSLGVRQYQEPTYVDPMFKEFW